MSTLKGQIRKFWTKVQKFNASLGVRSELLKYRNSDQVQGCMEKKPSKQEGNKNLKLKQTNSKNRDILHTLSLLS
jgi:hypothetical protein